MGPDSPDGPHNVRKCACNEWVFRVATFKRMTGEGGGGLENADDRVM